MEMALCMLILALMIVLALMFYERNRRTDRARSELLRRRVYGNFVAPALRTGFAVELQHPGRHVALDVQSLQPLQRWLAQAGLDMPAEQFLILTVLLSVAGALLAALWLEIKTACLYGVAAAALPAAYVVVRRKRRLATFGQQLPYVLDFLRSALRSGHTLPHALQMSSQNAPEPIASELRLALDQMGYGATLADALESMFKRMPEQSLGLFVAAVRVQARVGSSIAEIIDRVTDTIRDHQRLEQQLKTLTAQARMSGLIVGCLPFILLALFTLIKPDYTGLLFHDPLGTEMLQAAIFLDIVGVLIIRRMVRVS